MGFVKPTPWSIISFEFMRLLLLTVSMAPLPGLHAETDTKKGDCWYILEVKTSNWPHKKAGTDNPVRVRFMDIKGSDVTIHPLNDPFDVDPGKKSNPFKRGATARFNISDRPCLDKVCSLQFQVQGDDEWRVDYAQVHGKSVSRFRCHYHTKLPANAWSGYDLCNLNEQSPSSLKVFYACENENGIGKIQGQQTDKKNPCSAKARKGKANC